MAKKKHKTKKKKSFFQEAEELLLNLQAVEAESDLLLAKQKKAASR